MPHNLKLVTPPAAEPITLAEATLYLRVDGSDQDTLINALITGCRLQAENITGLAILPQTWDYVLDRLPGADLLSPEPLQLPRNPVTAVGSIKTYDADGLETTWAASNYRLDTVGNRIIPLVQWPNAVSAVVRFTAGYADAAAVPADIKTAILRMVATNYEHREDISSGVNFVQMPYDAGLILRRYAPIWL